MQARSRFASAGLVLVTLALLAAVSCRSSKPTSAAQATPAVPGVAATEVTIGAHFPKTGNSSTYAPIAQAMQAYFDYVNHEQGGVNGRAIKFVVRDDQSNPAVALAVTKQLVQSDDVFAFDGSLGTPTHAAAVGYLNDLHVPDMFVFSGASLFNDSSKYPYTFPFTPSYRREARILAEYADQHWAGMKVGVLYQNDDFGKDYLNAFVSGLQGKLQVVAQQSYELTTSDVASQMTALKSSGAQVLAVFAIPKFAALAFRFLGDSGWKPHTLMTSILADPSVIKAAGASNMEGVVTANYLPLISDRSDPNVQLAERIMTKYAPGAQVSQYTLMGMANAQLMVATLKRAGKDLTRKGLIKAADSLRDFKFMALSAATITASDHSPLHCERPMQLANGGFVYVGDTICA